MKWIWHLGGSARLVTKAGATGTLVNCSHVAFVIVSNKIHPATSALLLLPGLAQLPWTQVVYVTVTHFVLSVLNLSP
jgi:hypothetical protein